MRVARDRPLDRARGRAVDVPTRPPGPGRRVSPETSRVRRASRARRARRAVHERADARRADERARGARGRGRLVVAGPSPAGERAAYVKTPSGLVYEDVNRGEGEPAASGDIAVFEYVMRRANGYFIYGTIDCGIGCGNGDPSRRARAGGRLIRTGRIAHRDATGREAQGVDKARIGVSRRSDDFAAATARVRPKKADSTRELESAGRASHIRGAVDQDSPGCVTRRRLRATLG